MLYISFSNHYRNDDSQTITDMLNKFSLNSAIAADADQKHFASRSTKIAEINSYFKAPPTDDENEKESESPIIGFFSQIQAKNATLKITNFTTSEFH